MKLFFNRKPNTLDKESELYLIRKDMISNTDTNRNNLLFRALFNFLRPSHHDRYYEAQDNMKALLAQLEKDSAFKESLQKLFIYIFNNREIVTLFTNVGILNEDSFWEEFTSQLKNRFLPPIPNKRSINHLLETTFDKKDDYKWVNVIESDLWIQFFKQLYSTKSVKSNPFKEQLRQALSILSVKVSYLGLAPELSKHIRVHHEIQSPFLEQNRSTQTFINVVENESSLPEFVLECAEQLIKQIEACQKVVDKVRAGTTKNGTSLGQSYTLLRTEQQLARMRIIISVLTPGSVMSLRVWVSSATIFKHVVYSVNTRNSISNLYRQNFSMLAYQIAEHKSESGEHYITTTRDEYYDFFFAAAAGGAIIVLAATMKALLHSIDMAMFWQYFCYGLNYAIAFVILFVTGASLATKQPAMTASALASSLDSKKLKGDVSFRGLALTFSKVWRSQFAAFVGNLIVVFPVSYIVDVVWYYVTGHHLLHTPEESLQNLKAQNPLESLAWFYACITGVFLFISGIITGYFDNRAKFSNIGPRITNHPTLKKYVEGNRLRVAGEYIEKSLGGIIGNISLGFMLGFAGMIGYTFGIAFDIRHITISTAYFAFGVSGLNNNLSAYDWLWTSIGVIGIGFINFAVSFSLAFLVALRSRNVSLSNVPKVMRYIVKYFIKYPIDFIFPPKEERKESDVFGADSQNN